MNVAIVKRAVALVLGAISVTALSAAHGQENCCAVPTSSGSAVTDESKAKDNLGDLSTFHLSIGGMTCAGCADMVEKSVAMLDGVKDVRVDFEKASATVQADSDVSIRHVVHAVKEGGFEATPTNLLSFYDVPLVCGAAPDLGCGHRAKPVLEELEQLSSVEEAWLNRTGTIMAVVWAEENALNEEERSTLSVLKKNALGTKHLTGKSHEEALRAFLSNERWYKGSAVSMLDDEVKERLSASE